MKKTIILILLLVFMRANVYCQKSVQYYGSHSVFYIENNPSTTRTSSLAGYRLKVHYDSDGDIESFVERCVNMAGTLMSPDEYDVGWLIEDGDGFSTYCFDADENKRIAISDNKKVVVKHIITELLGGERMHSLSYYTRNPSNGGSGNFVNGGFSGGGGSFVMPDNSGSGSSSGRICSGCGGSGNCTGCGGSGKYWVDSGTYTGSGSQTRVNCGSCGGSGRCRVCYGKGRL